LVYMLLNASAVAMVTTFAHPPTTAMMGHVSWTAVVILICAMIAPTSPRKTLAAALVAASMDPIAMWLAHLAGRPVQSALNTAVLFMPNYALAFAATWPSFVLRKMGGRLREARDLGSYELVELLGRGGMGEVWRARHRMLARHAAIKLVRPELLGAADD